MNISATLSSSEQTIQDIVNQFDSTKSCLFWSGISASNTAEQKKYEEKIEKAKQYSRSDKLDQDLEKIMLRHEHKQRGQHFIATLKALKLLQTDLAQHNYQLNQFVFCETSYLHRHNRLWVEDLQNLEIEEAGEKAVEYFGQPWRKDAQTAIESIFNRHDYPKISLWKDWLATTLAKKYIQKTKQEYQNNSAFKAVVDQAALNKITSKSFDNPAFQNSVAYLLEEAAKVWGLQEEFDDFNLIVAYPGDLPPAVQYLIAQQYFNFSYFKIEFSSRLIPQKQMVSNKGKQPVELILTSPTKSSAAVVEPNPSHSNPSSLSPIQQLLCAINNLPAPAHLKNSLWSHSITELLKNKQSPKELFDFGKELLDNTPDIESDPVKIEKLRSALISTLNISAETSNGLALKADHNFQQSTAVQSSRRSIRGWVRKQLTPCSSQKLSSSSSTPSPKR